MVKINIIYQLSQVKWIKRNDQSLQYRYSFFNDCIYYVLWFMSRYPHKASWTHKRDFLEMVGYRVCDAMIKVCDNQKGLT